MKDKTVLLIPGLGGSSPDHWQARWASQDTGFRIVEQSDWTAPDAERWTEALDRAVARAGGPVVLVAHSLGCALVARWVRVAQRHRYSAVKGAMLVAPADVDDVDRTPDVVRSFAPISLQAMPFRSVVAASEDDPYIGLDRAVLFAHQWGASFRNLGRRGHVNDTSGLGDWPEGRAILEDLLATAEDARPDDTQERTRSMTSVNRIHASILERIGGTPLIELQHLVPEGSARILVKLESQNPTGSMKDRMGLAMVEAADVQVPG